MTLYSSTSLNLLGLGDVLSRTPGDIVGQRFPRDTFSNTQYTNELSSVDYINLKHRKLQERVLRQPNRDMMFKELLSIKAYATVSQDDPGDTNVRVLSFSPYIMSLPSTTRNCIIKTAEFIKEGKYAECLRAISLDSKQLVCSDSCTKFIHNGSTITYPSSMEFILVSTVKNKDMLTHLKALCQNYTASHDNKVVLAVAYNNSSSVLIKPVGTTVYDLITDRTFFNELHKLL